MAVNAIKLNGTIESLKADLVKRTARLVLIVDLGQLDDQTELLIAEAAQDEQYMTVRMEPHQLRLWDPQVIPGETTVEYSTKLPHDEAAGE